MQHPTPPNGPQAGPKNFVFVDEQNRHKRLKVMRACEGCRRRKIKCDAATTNTWPCAACTRLKLQCVPPAGGNEFENGAPGSFTESEAGDYHGYIQTQITPPHADHSGVQNYSQSYYPPSGVSQRAYEGYGFPNQSNVFSVHENLYSQQYPSVQHIPPSHDNVYGQGQPAYNSNLTPVDDIKSISDQAGVLDTYTAEDLSQQLGELQIAESGIALYTRKQEEGSREAEAPIQEEKVKVPALSSAGTRIRVPPDLIPEDALDLFKVFFRDVHPYVPVVVRNRFYYQWSSERDSISPLLLEAIFACALRMCDDFGTGGMNWLEMANQHEESFLDTPRLSTLQAMLLLLKARESAPKPGYYYRSWMTCKKIVSMAKDLELHEHYDSHENNLPCCSDPVECLTKTRVWQSALICEMMVGAPQGRTDFGVEPNTVDISPYPLASDIDDFEKATSRRFAYFIRNARNIRLITDAARKLRKQKDWGNNPELVKYNVAFRHWPGELPSDLQILLPEDGSPPTLTTHFLGNMHSHYHLGIVMLRRPQLKASKTFSEDSTWKLHMSVCYGSAKVLCRLQEAILMQYGLNGLICMIRGINFTIYVILTCVMIHLIAITSPDPDFNRDARDFFVRHMRILEQCVQAWPMKDTEAQIDGLRAAFSADLSKPFDLKASFPLGSPSTTTSEPGASPQQREGSSQQHFGMPPQVHIPQHLEHTPQSYLVTPPVSAVSDSKPHSPFQQYPGPNSYPPIAQSAFIPPPTSQQHQWNPTPIIEQFDTAFAIPQSHLDPSSSQPTHSVQYSSSPPHTLAPPQSYFSQPQIPQSQYTADIYAQQQPQTYIHPQHYSDVTQYPETSMTTQPMPHSTQPYIAQAGMFVTPKQWQQSVASVLDPGGLKRRWNYEQSEQGMYKQMAKRSR